MSSGTGSNPGDSRSPYVRMTETRLPARPVRVRRHIGACSLQLQHLHLNLVYLLCDHIGSRGRCRHYGKYRHRGVDLYELEGEEETRPCASWFSPSLCVSHLF